MLSEERKSKLIIALRKELRQNPEFDVEKTYDESYRYERLKISTDILEQVIFYESKNIRLILIFPVNELRKLDLSEIDFVGVDIKYTDLNNTSAKAEKDFVDKFICTVKKLVKSKNTKV